MSVKRFLYTLGVLTFLTSCSTKRNSVVSRAYHNLTARYNGYYYSTLNIEEGVYKINKNNKDNFDKILPVFVYPTPDKAKATFAEFDKAIKKSSLCIQKHAIKDKSNNEIPSAGKWIDNNWINIGIAHFYKREFFSGLESFEYVARTYTKSKDKYTAMIWMIKANNEVGAVSSSEPIISLLKNEKKLPSKIKNELPAVEADYYMRRGQYTEAAAKLMEASRNTNIFNGVSKSQRARYSFIIAQMFEAQKENKRALQYYKRTIKLKPNYDMVFYSKIKMARLLDVKRNNSEKTKKDLLKMTREFKNNDYYDVIFYTLGEIEEKERNTDKALYYYKRSVQTSTVNISQKALSYLKLGEINFDLANYPPAEAYYDSAVVTLPKDHPDYNSIVARKKTLEALVSNIRIIKTEDSLQRFAKLSESERNALIDKLIANAEKEEERKMKEKDVMLSNNSLPGNLSVPGNITSDPAAAASFYFYNQNTISFGVADFQKKWGTRKLEDNWRRSNKAMVMETVNNNTDPKAGNTSGSNKGPKNSREFYEKNLPLTDSLLNTSTNRIIDAYYVMGSIYKEELNNTTKAEATFEELNQRFPKNKYLLNNYYVLYRMYSADKKTDKADYYKQKLLNEFPESEFALLIKNPNYAEELNAKMSEVEEFYATAYTAYTENNFSEAIQLSNKGIKKFGKNDYLPKFEFIKALSTGKVKGIDSMEVELKLLVINFPKSEVAPLANDILMSIKKQKNPDMFKPSEPGKIQTDTFGVNFDAEHFLIALVPDDPKIADAFKTSLNAFSTKYFSTKQFNMTSNLFNNEKQLVILKSFANADEVVAYYDYLLNDKDVFKSPLKRELFEIYPISAANLPFLFKTKNIKGYELFYNDNYKKFSGGRK
ncbi:MAG: tol-pal system protein YbgF [Bacteroidetes bacterium]|nr:tol-pal system protein YbgF [Bacteroidota bacterium]